MKTISVQVTDVSIVSNAIKELDLKISDSTKQTPEFHIIFGQMEDCVEDFVKKAKTLARAGTTIHISKEFTFPDVNILITLDYPKNISFMDKLKRIFQKS